MNWILAIPLELRLVLLFVAGTIAGALVNLAAYRLAWHARRISPWSAQDERAAGLKIPPRRAFDRMPVWGWLGLRREAPLHGQFFWIRPMLVEIFCGFGLAWLYCWEVERAALLTAEFTKAIPDSWAFMLHAQFAAHTLLFWLMLAASLIDIDEKTIPDSITVPGTLAGLAIAAAFPLVLLPAVVMPQDVGIPADVIVGIFWQNTTPQDWPLMTVTAPSPMPDWLGARPHAISLVIAIACWWLACFALMRRQWRGRHGWQRALVLFSARLRRESSTYWLAIAGVAGSIAIYAIWSGCQRSWPGLLTAIVGMAASGGLVWAIRIIASAIMRREAMGFGDVTLMAMIGAFLGWQACLIVFFLAPLIALVVGIVVLVLRREHEIPYGPFLCLAAMIVTVRWASVWQWAEPRFALGPIIPAMVFFCLILLAVLLGLLQAMRRAIQ